MKCALPSIPLVFITCMPRQCFQSLSKLMRRFTIWEDKWKIVLCFLYKCISSDKQPHPGLCRFSQYMTDQWINLWNLSRCFFLNLSVKDFSLASFSDCFLWAIPACPPRTDHDLCIRKLLCHCGVGILPMNGNVDAFRYLRYHNTTAAFLNSQSFW